MTKPRAATAVPAQQGVVWTTVRLVLLGGGLVVTAVGGLKLMRSGFDNLLAGLWWLMGGVVLHDALLAPLTLLILWGAAKLLPTWLRAPAAAGFVVLGTVTVAAIPVLTRFGARPDNPTLLDRNYMAGWLALAALVVVAVAAAGWRRRLADTVLTSDGETVNEAASDAGWRSPP